MGRIPGRDSGSEDFTIAVTHGIVSLRLIPCDSAAASVSHQSLDFTPKRRLKAFKSSCTISWELMPWQRARLQRLQSFIDGNVSTRKLPIFRWKLIYAKRQKQLCHIFSMMFQTLGPLPARYFQNSPLRHREKSSFSPEHKCCNRNGGGREAASAFNLPSAPSSAAAELHSC